MSTYAYQLLKVKTGFADDPDYSATQTAPPELVVIAPQKESIVNVQVELVVEWLDGADAVVPGKGSFDIHVEKYNFASPNNLFKLFAGSAVIVKMYPFRFGKKILVTKFLKLFLVNKIVLAAVDFALSLFTGCVGYGKSPGFIFPD